MRRDSSYRVGVMLVLALSGCVPAIGVIVASQSGGGGGSGAGGPARSGDTRPPVTTATVTSRGTSYGFTLTTDEPATTYLTFTQPHLYGAPLDSAQSSTDGLTGGFDARGATITFVFYSVDLAGNRETVQTREYDGDTGALLRRTPDPAVRPPTDLNGDGYADLVVGAPDRASGTGRVHVYFGGPTIRSRSLADDVADLSFTGEALGDAFGASLVLADVTGDGLVDLVVGAPGADAAGTDAGRVYVFRGGPTLQGRDLSAGGTADLVITGPEAFSRLGASLAAGDLDGDGAKEVACGAPNDPASATATAGRVQILRGGVLSPGVLTLHGAHAGDGFGSALAMGDVSGDGRDDLLVGAPREDGTAREAGAVHVYRGGSLGALSGAGLDAGGASTPTFRGAAQGDAFGASLSTGDVTGDGVADLVVGAPLVDVPGPDRGSVHVFRGGAGLADQDLAAGGTADVTLAAAGVGVGAEEFGRTVVVVDMNGDGTPDVAASAPASGSGRVLVFAGGAGLSSAALPLLSLDGDSASGFGTGLSPCDLNGDGRQDLAVGEPGFDSFTTDSGRVRLFTGSGGSAGATFTGEPGRTSFGQFVGR